MSQRYGPEQVGAVDPPFTPAIMATLYLARFKMPTIAPSNGSTNADEYLDNYQAHMLIRNANEATLYKALCLTFIGIAQQWYRRLIQGMMDSFKQLSDAFSAAFLNAKTRKKETPYLFRITRGENEPLKMYLDRFDKAIMQVKNCSDYTLIQAFREGFGDKKLLWTIAYDVPPTFAHLRGIAQKHAEAEEYIKGQNSSLGETSLPVGKKKPKKDGVDHIRASTEKATCKTEAIPGPKMAPIERARSNHTLPQTSDWTNARGLEHIVHTIFGRMATGDTASSKRSYARNARQVACGEYINMAEPITKISRQDNVSITFTDDEANKLLNPHNDALVGEIKITDNIVQRVLIDNGSSADI
ncbi:hypothetical protein TIFTF001_029633 [Ficus carica]|uniref:Retrotransposon gag domain-containing protein n=1 Tax=Ficus carica TaxID=3494 RepID=A0AA88J2P7_FICCA|nr:hypothetical protein TIFTF001_029633 [Ficus carica]